MKRPKDITKDEFFASRYRQSSRYGFYINDESKVETLTDIIGSERWVILDVNPQQVTMREPMATAISFTQGGGKIRESRGNLVKPVTIAGTTGYTPLPSNQSLHTSPVPVFVGKVPTRGSLTGFNEAVTDKMLAARSGFWAFHRLRHLFRLYAWEMERGNTSLTMNYIDTKNDEYWRIEPQEFVMQRSSRKPFSYDYNIAFSCLHESTNGDVRDDLELWLGPVDSIQGPGVKQSIRRLKETHGSMLDGLKKLSGKAQRAMQGALNSVNSVVSFFEGISDAISVIKDTANVLLSQLDSSMAGIADVIGQLNEDTDAGRAAFSVDNKLIQAMNEWYCETIHTVDFLRVQVVNFFDGRTDVVKTNKVFSTGTARQGLASDAIPEVPGSLGSPDVNPFIGSSGLGLVTDVKKLANTRAVRSIVINDGDTIFSLAKRLLGDEQRFVDLIIINNLSAPYIVSSSAQRPYGTLAWGDIILVPTGASSTASKAESPPASAPTFSGEITSPGTSLQIIDTTQVDAGLPGWMENHFIGYTVSLEIAGVAQTRVVVSNTASSLSVNLPWSPVPGVGVTYSLTLQLFTLHRPVTPEAKTFGVDILLAFRPSTGDVSSTLLADVVINSRKDLALVRGLENFFQACNIRLRLEQGRLPLHPSFGIQQPIGRPWSNDVAILYNALVRESLLQDRRIDQVRNTQLSFSGGAFNFSADVQPVGVKNSRPVSVALP